MDEQEKGTQQEPGQRPQQQEPGEPDYKALWEQAKQDARKWEDRSKANLGKLRDAPSAEEFEEVKRALDELTRERDSLRADSEFRAAVDMVSAETGFPASVVAALKGTNADELRVSARALGGLQPGNPYPPTRDRGETTPTRPTRESILAIKDRDEREAAIIANLDQFE